MLWGRSLCLIVNFQDLEQQFPQEELAKFGYRLERKVENLRILLYLGKMLEPIV